MINWRDNERRKNFSSLLERHRDDSSTEHFVKLHRPLWSKLSFGLCVLQKYLTLPRRLIRINRGSLDSQDRNAAISNVRLSVLDTASRVHLDMSAGNARVVLSAVTLALPEPIAIVSRLPRTAPRSIHADDRYRTGAIGHPCAIGIPRGNNIIMAGWRCLKRGEATGKWSTCSTCPNNLKSSSSPRRYRRIV